MLQGNAIACSKHLH